MNATTEQARRIYNKQQRDAQQAAQAMARAEATGTFKGHSEEVIATLDAAGWSFDHYDSQVEVIQTAARDEAAVVADKNVAAELSKLESDMAANSAWFGKQKAIADSKSHELAARRNELLARQCSLTEATTRLRKTFAQRWPVEAAEMKRLHDERTRLAMEARDLERSLQPSSSSSPVGGKMQAAKHAVIEAKQALQPHQQTSDQLESAKTRLQGVQKVWDAEKRKLDQLNAEIRKIDEQLKPYQALELKA